MMDSSEEEQKTWTPSRENTTMEIDDVDGVDQKLISEEDDIVAGTANAGTDHMPDPPQPNFSPNSAAPSDSGQHLVSPGEIKQKVGEVTGQVLSQVKSSAGHAIDQSKQTANQAIGSTKQQVVQQLTTQKGRAADAIGRLREPITEIGQTFSSHGQPQLSQWSQSFANQIDQAADYVRTSDFDVITRDAQAFAKENPALVIGGAFLLGLLTARFFKSSAPAMATDAPVPVSPQSSYTKTEPLAAEDGFSEEPLPEHNPLSAHGYVAGGILGGANT